MTDKTMPAPRYSIWQSIAVCLNLATRALQEARLPREPGPPGPQGEAGRDGASFTVRATWSADLIYNALDVVALGGAAFVARCDDPGPCPGENWQMISRQGKPGAQGERGLRGERGEPGPAGPAPTALDVDEEGLLTLRLGDGTELTCDFYPVLARLVR